MANNYAGTASFDEYIPVPDENDDVGALAGQPNPTQNFVEALANRTVSNKSRIDKPPVYAADGVNNYIATPGLDSLSDNQMLIIIPSNDNTGAATLAIDGGAAHDIVSPSGEALTADKLRAGVGHLLLYDETNTRWFLCNPDWDWLYEDITIIVNVGGDLDLYVDADAADDTGDGRSWGTAKKTIAGALAEIQYITPFSVTIHLKAGTATPNTYSGYIDWNRMTGNKFELYIVGDSTDVDKCELDGVCTMNNVKVKFENLKFTVSGGPGAWLMNGAYGHFVRCKFACTNASENVIVDDRSYALIDANCSLDTTGLFIGVYNYSHAKVYFSGGTASGWTAPVVNLEYNSTILFGENVSFTNLHDSVTPFDAKDRSMIIFEGNLTVNGGKQLVKLRGESMIHVDGVVDYDTDTDYAASATYKVIDLDEGSKAHFAGNVDLNASTDYDSGTLVTALDLNAGSDAYFGGNLTAHNVTTGVSCLHSSKVHGAAGSILTVNCLTSGGVYGIACFGGSKVHFDTITLIGGDASHSGLVAVNTDSASSFVTYDAGGGLTRTYWTDDYVNDVSITKITS